MWAEPLTPGVTPVTRERFLAEVYAGDRMLVAQVPCAVNPDARTGYFGAMQLDNDGGARQKLRAMVLLVRVALHHAERLGITRVMTDVPNTEALQEFAARMCDFAGEPRAAGVRRFRGDLAAIRTHVLDSTRDDGTELDSPLHADGEGPGVR